MKKIDKDYLQDVSPLCSHSTLYTTNKTLIIFIVIMLTVSL